MSLRMVEGGEPGTSRDGPRILAPGAPPSPGPLPNELARHLRFGEALAWWGSKDDLALGPIGVAGAAAVLTLGIVSVFAPELWSQPWSALWPPLLALLSPTLFVLAREWMTRRAILVTDEAIVGVDRHGEAVRIGIDAVSRVRRDWLGGGVRLDDRRGHTIRIPPALQDDAHRAIVSRLRGRIRGSTAVEDTTGFWPP